MTGFYNWYNEIGARFNTKNNLHYIDIFNGKIDKNNDNEKTGWDIFLHTVDSFITKYKLYYDFSSVIVDDHFGIAAKTAGNVEIMKQRLKDRDENFKNESNDVILKRGLVDLVSKRVKDLSDFLWNNHAVALSISVNPFNFKKAEYTDPNATEAEGGWHNALQTNYHDVAKWIERGYIRGDRGGEINVQMYRKNPETVIELYDTLYKKLQGHLHGKPAEYIRTFPKIAVSFAAEGATDGPWEASRKDIKQILDHITLNKNNSIVGTYHGKEVKIRISGFDGDDFHNMKAE